MDSSKMFATYGLQPWLHKLSSDSDSDPESELDEEDEDEEEEDEDEDILYERR